MTVEELCQSIETKRREIHSRDLGPWARNNMVASDIGDCARESVLSILNWRERPAFDPDIKARLERGNKIEDLALAELQNLGYRVRVERRPFEIKNDGGQILCRGRVDGFIQMDGKDIPFECKSINPNVYNQINEEADFDRYLFFRKWPRQLQTYLFANNIEEGFFLLDDCLGHWRLLPVRLDYERMEKILLQLETVADHIEAKTLPDYHKDPSICLRCWARGRVCDPPFFTQGEGLKVIADPELEQKLNRRAELDPMASEYDKLDKELKELFRGKDGLIIGNWLISGKATKRKGYEVKPSEGWKVEIETITDAPGA